MVETLRQEGKIWFCAIARFPGMFRCFVHIQINFESGVVLVHVISGLTVSNLVVHLRKRTVDSLGASQDTLLACTKRRRIFSSHKNSIKAIFKTTTNMTICSQPNLPPLYFNEHRAPNDANRNTAEHDIPELPAEILSLCFTKFANWGDLAKLACVQKSWSDILTDAAKNSLESKWELAQSLMEGRCGLQKNAKRSVKILKELANIETDENDMPQKVAENGECFAPALKKISECYLEGNGLEKNLQLGVAWLQAAFELGDNVEAAHDMALIYEFGRHGVEIDVFAAAEWFQKAAEKGHVEAMAELGLCYELGCGVEQNDEEALDWYTKAANLGHVTSKYSVGEAFEEARGVPQSDEEACLWYYRAAAVGDEDSKVALRRLYDIARIVVPGVAEILDV